VKVLVTRAGLEPYHYIDESQVIDSTKRQKRQNRYLSQTEVHGGYTGSNPGVADAKNRVAVYARVSTLDQDCSMQLHELRTYCAARVWDVTGRYVDTGWSGAKKSRPQFDRLMQDASGLTPEAFSLGTS
jgi:predicted site-specific integrase-resolvase